MVLAISKSMVLYAKRLLKKNKELAYVLSGFAATIDDIHIELHQENARELNHYRARRDQCIAELDRITDRLCKLRKQLPTVQH
jgi:hypothetical protein